MKGKTTGKLIKWIKCFLSVLLKVTKILFSLLNRLYSNRIQSFSATMTFGEDTKFGRKVIPLLWDLHSLNVYRISSITIPKSLNLYKFGKKIQILEGL